MSIEAWVTDPAGNYLAHLERSADSPFRRFAIRAELNGVGVGSLEYHLDNAVVAAFDDLFGYGNLVWFKYRGKTRTWIVENRVTVLDGGENDTDWVRVAGRGVRQLLADRTVWPTHYSDATPDPKQWELGGWTTKTDAVATVGTLVVPVVSTTAGLGATVNDPVEIVGGGNRQIGIIDSIVAGVSVTLKDPLAYTFPKGSRVRSAARQWRRFVNRAAGKMLWDNINESNARFVADGSPAIVQGTVETTGADGWTQDFRFDNQLLVVEEVEKLYGDVEMDGLTFNYWNARGTDRTTSVIFEEGADILRLSVEDDDRDSLSWVVAEGTGHAVYSFLAPKKKTTRSQRKTHKRSRTKHRKAPPAPKRKAIIVKADYLIDFADEAVGVPRRREAFLDAKDVSDPVQLDALADAALDEHQVTEAVGLELAETRYQADMHYGLGDWVRAIAPSRGFDEDVRIVTLTFAEDDSEIVKVLVDVNTRRQQALIKLADGNKNTQASLGVQNRQPQGQLVPYSFSGQGILDSGSPLYVFVKIPDRVNALIEASVTLAFRQFLASATAASSGGGSTSGSGGSSTSASGGAHMHLWGGWQSNTPGGYGVKNFGDGGVGKPFDMAAAFSSDYVTNDAVDHTHAISSHTHSTPNHTHGLDYGTFEETYPASHSVTLRVYERTDTTWTLRGTFSGLTADLVDVDLTSVMTGPGDWRLTIQSAGGQPNGGRLGCDVFGAITGAIQSA